MTNRCVILFVCLMSFSVSNAQNVPKIHKKLEKAHQKGNIEKLEKKAKKLNVKYPRLDEPIYYLSLVELIRFNEIKNVPNKKQWNHLRKASMYAKKLSNNYSYWDDTIKNEYVEYIDSWNDNSYESSHLKKVVKTYSTLTKDTLVEYYNYYNRVITRSNTTSHKIPITDALRTELIKFASQLVGIPYKYAGEKPETGFDCSGFVLYVYKSVGIDLPHNAHLQSQLEGKIIPLEKAKPGDLIFFGNKRADNTWSTQHAGIIYEYNENEPKVIHCVSGGVNIDGNNTSWDHYWKERILFVKRLPELEK